MSPTLKAWLHWKRILKVLGLLLAGVAVLFGVSLYHLVHTEIPESYRSWMTGDLLVRYLQIHTNQWPRNWDDLASVTNDPGPLSQYVAVENLRQTVKIDWQVDVRQLQQMARSDSNVTLRVVTRLDGSRLRSSWGADTEPNAKILRYLQASLGTNGGVPGPVLTLPSASPHP